MREGVREGGREEVGEREMEIEGERGKWLRQTTITFVSNTH